MKTWPFGVTVLVAMVVASALGGCSSGHAGGPDDGFDLGSFLRNPYPRHAHPGYHAEPNGSTVDVHTYTLPNGPVPPNAIGWARPYDHIPFNALAKVREVENCPPDSTYARVGPQGIFCIYPENQWFADCMNEQWLAARYRDRHLWVLHQLVRDDRNRPWLETYAEDEEDRPRKRCRIQLNPPPSRHSSSY